MIKTQYYTVAIINIINLCVMEVAFVLSHVRLCVCV